MPQQLVLDRNTGNIALYDDATGEMMPAKVERNPRTKETRAWDGSKWVTVTPATRTGGEMAEDVGRSIAQGATLGWADELAAVADTALGTGAGKPTYAENLAAQKARTAETPFGSRMLGETAGGVAGLGLLTAPARVARGLAAVPDWMRNVGIGAGVGASMGAGQAQPGQRLEEAGKGAMLGGALGVGVPFALNTLGGFTNAFNPGTVAARDLARGFSRSELTPQRAQEMLTEMQQYRPQATLADVGGTGVGDLIERAAQTGGRGRTMIKSALEARQEGQRLRIAADLKELTGTTRSAVAAIDETIAARKQGAGPLYDAAMNFNARAHPEIMSAWQDATRTGYGKAFLQSDDYKKMLQTEYGYEDPALAPLMQQIDAWKRVANDFVGDNLGNERGRVVKNLIDRVIPVVDQLNPDYAKARNVYAGHSQYLRMIEEGRAINRRDVSAEELAGKWARMSDADKEAYKVGAVSSLIGQMGADPAKRADMTKYLRSPNMREKIAVLMPENVREDWARRLGYEVRSSELVNQALGGSPTARRQFQQEDARDIAVDLVLDVFKGAPPVSLLMRMFSGSGPLTDRLRARTNERIADVTMTPPSTPQELGRAIQAMSTRAPEAPSVLRRRATAIGGAVPYAEGLTED